MNSFTSLPTVFQHPLCEQKKMGVFTLLFVPYTLQLRHVFRLATGARTTTPVVLIALGYEGQWGYGEASMPPYLGESHESVLSFLRKVDLNCFDSPWLIDSILTYIDQIAPLNTAAKAALDIALHDLTGKLAHQPLHRLWGLDPFCTPSTSMTIGIDTPEIVREKVEEARNYPLLKIKLGLESDRQMIETIRTVSDQPLCADVNQGWRNKENALEMTHWLAEQGVIFIEQPMPKEQIDDNAWLTERSPIPTIADEAVQRLDDITALQGIYSGINIKLMKCTGLREAMKMIQVARALRLKVMLGCMTETSCAITAAAHLSPLVDWADLDGALLISNDVYKGMQLTKGKIHLPQSPGIGLTHHQG
jgi:L-alanine-DL-glutamate epimerase-like enolase superfamily enzyme